MSNELSIFTSPAGKEAFLAAYNALIELWPVKTDSLDVNTRFGVTHVNACGPTDVPPLLLLHAAGFSSAAWFANVESLSQQHRVYAVDIIGDAGKSIVTQRLESWSDHAEWLKDVLDGLAIRQAHVAGHSQGGWMAMALAISYPQSVNKLVLLAPAASLQRFRWFVRLNLSLARHMIRPSARNSLRFVSAGEVHLFEPFVRMMEMVNRHCRPVTMVPTVYSDEELRRITVPTLLLIGDHEKIYSPVAAIERAKQRMPDVTAEIVPNAGHLLISEQLNLVNGRIVGFLTGDCAPAE